MVATNQTIKSDIEALYDSLTSVPTRQTSVTKIAEVLRVVDRRFDHYHDPVAVANRLAIYIIFTAFNAHLHFTPKQDELLEAINEYGQRASRNGYYAGNYGNVAQFDRL